MYNFTSKHLNIRNFGMLTFEIVLENNKIKNKKNDDLFRNLELRQFLKKLSCMFFHY